MQDVSSEHITCATMLTGEAYLIGALVLGHSLRQHGWTDETVALVTSDIGSQARERLKRYWNRIVEVENIPNPNPPEKFGFGHYGTMYTKLRLWELEEYSRLIYIDSDAVVLGCLDELKQGADFAASPCTWTPDSFNAGVLVIKPSRKVFNDMMLKIGTTPSHDGGDQGFLNNYYSDWFSGPADRRLRAEYNLQQVIYLYGPAWEKAKPHLKILHFTGPKPWRYRSVHGPRLARAYLQRFTPASRNGPTPSEIWWEIRNSLPRELM